MSYSSGGGGTLTLPSPTHVHHVDVGSAVRSLRRSLSRSPSKFNLVKKSPSSSPKSPLSPSPLSPPKRAKSNPTIFQGFGNPPNTPSPLAVPFPPSAKLALRSSGRSKTAPVRPILTRKTSPRSPMKRALNHGPDSGNTAPPVLTTWTAGGQENASRSKSPTERKNFERNNRMSLNLDSPGPINHALSRLGGEGSSENPGASTSSPLKRSDAIMNLDQASLGSPVAKRRSLHGSASFGHDFNVFDHGPAATYTPQFEIHDDATPEYELSTASITSDNSSSFTSMPRRSSSLRKSTLQQRHGEKTSWGRRHAAQVLAAQQQQLANAGNAITEVSTPGPVKNRPRLSLDQFMPPLARDSPFSSQGSLPPASMHMTNQPAHQPHPLSRTMTTSSSNSSLPDESPTHVPVHFGDQPRPKLDFSKSLPAGSLRPFSLDTASGESGTFSTPQNYKSVKPLPSAFASTGIISKVNRHPEDEPRARGGKVMPDTPCKKQNNPFATYPANIPGSAIAKARHIRHSFGNPSTPFNPNGSGIASTFGNGSGVFGGGYKSLTRRGSFLSIDGDEDGSPDAKRGSQGSEFDLPPTPTKQAFTSSHIQWHGNGSPSNHRGLSASTSIHGFSKKLVRTSSKLNLSASPIQHEAEDSDASMDMNDSPTPANKDFASQTFMSMPSFRHSRSHRRNPTLQSPTPLMPRSITVSSLSPSSKRGFAKFSHVAPASPLERIDFLERLSPRTPVDGGFTPPDPSGLSISNPRDMPLSKARGNRSSMPPPETPTTGRDYFPAIIDRRLSTTPVHTVPAVNSDESISSRFEKSELIGSGEFSFVYRVTQTFSRTAEAARPFFFGTSVSPAQATTPPTPMPERVFAVKKARTPYGGNKDRQKRLQEVNILRALGKSDHVVDLIDSWEDKNYLYIQTEFCEEGSLDVFLNQVGFRDRMDDFRIWKLMLEISKGLRHIHDSGFVHLDIKPANIFITFEGVIKIGDFGMASEWPAQPGDGEGDRQYMGPEVLKGQGDKPSDIFALGLIIIEMACNLVLPDNGELWQQFRSGDISAIPSLTFSSITGIARDATGMPLVDESDTTMDSYLSDDEVEADLGSPTVISRKRNFNASSKSLSHDPSNLFGSGRRGELHAPPNFMMNQHNEFSLDSMARWMISENPQDRPTAQQILDSPAVQWVESRRRAGATVFEGNWGPADDVLADDAEMMDV